MKKRTKRIEKIVKKCIIRIEKFVKMYLVCGRRMMILKRKAYQALLKWKELSEGTSAILVEGARRTGKSTLVEEFAKKEYQDYLLLDFARETREIKQNFVDNMNDLDSFFRNLFLLKGKSLPRRKVVIIWKQVP